jgi:hypothetical protein
MESNSANAANNTKLTPEERATAIRLLEESEKEFLAVVEGVADEQLDLKPSSDAWSIREIAEHVVLAEELLFGIIQRALASEPNPDWETATAGKEVTLENILAARVGRAAAPEAILPTHKMSRDDIIKRFKAGRARSYELIETTDASFKDRTFDNPYPVFGTLNAYQWFLYIPQHTFRHIKQITEVQQVV